MTFLVFLFADSSFNTWSESSWQVKTAENPYYMFCWSGKTLAKHGEVWSIKGSDSDHTTKEICEWLSKFSPLATHLTATAGIPKSPWVSMLRTRTDLDDFEYLDFRKPPSRKRQLESTKRIKTQPVRKQQLFVRSFLPCSFLAIDR